MTSFPCVHHIEVGVVNGEETVKLLSTKFTFKLKAIRQTDVANQWLLVKNNARFLITSLKTMDAAAIQDDNFVVNWTSHLQSREPTSLPTKDTVFNVAFQVKDIDSCVKRMNCHDVTFNKRLRTVYDNQGLIRTCVIKSCIGDVHHTLVEKKSYTGHFLPGFTSVLDDIETSNDTADESLIECFDHVAVAVKANTSMSIIDWYEKCFGMKRFLINSDEDENEGLILSTHDVGLRLRALEYWKCSEVCLMTPEDEGIQCRLPFVIAEGLPPVPGSTEINQIEAWIDKHGCPGIQHIALSSSNIKVSIRNLRRIGVPFAKAPPATYYTKKGRLDDIISAGEDVDDLKDNEILIDTEADRIHSGKSYLLQIFTQPLFYRDPFFLEVIQRKGATGFGSGNVMALYRSVQAFIAGDGYKLEVS